MGEGGGGGGGETHIRVVKYLGNHTISKRVS